MATGFEYRCPTDPPLTGEGRVRHCARCRKDVYNLSQLTRSEAIATLAGHEKPCVQLTVERGRVRFRSAPSLSRLGRLGALAGALAGCGVEARPDPRCTGDVLTAEERLDELVAEAVANAGGAARLPSPGRSARRDLRYERALRDAAKRLDGLIAEAEAEARAAADAGCTEAIATAREAKRLSRSQRARAHVLGGI